jgi:hypothetical protein
MVHVHERTAHTFLPPRRPGPRRRCSTDPMRTLLPITLAATVALLVPAVAGASELQSSSPGRTLQR